MTHEEPHFVSAEQMAATAVPNEHCMPHLHVICYRKDFTTTTLKDLPLRNISENYLSEQREEIKSAYAKCVAFLKLFLSNDSHAAEYLLMSLISRCYKREPGFLIGSLNINLSGVSPQ